MVYCNKYEEFFQASKDKSAGSIYDLSLLMHEQIAIANYICLIK